MKHLQQILEMAVRGKANLDKIANFDATQMKNDIKNFKNGYNRCVKIFTSSKMKSDCKDFIDTNQYIFTNFDVHTSGKAKKAIEKLLENYLKPQLKTAFNNTETHYFGFTSPDATLAAVELTSMCDLQLDVDKTGNLVIKTVVVGAPDKRSNLIGSFDDIFDEDQFEYRGDNFSQTKKLFYHSEKSGVYINCEKLSNWMAAAAEALPKFFKEYFKMVETENFVE